MDDTQSDEYKKSFEIRLLERALIEDNCKYIKTFIQMIPRIIETVEEYKQNGDSGIFEKLSYHSGNQRYGMHFYLGTQVHRFI